MRSVYVRFFLMLCLVSCLFSCRGQERNAGSFTAAGPIPIHRFDRDLLQLLEKKDSTDTGNLPANDSLLLHLLERSLFKPSANDSVFSFARLAAYFSEPTLLQLYRQATQAFADVSPYEKSLGTAFAYLKNALPAMQVPAVYMHVSGLNQNVLVADSMLSISIDKYLGADFPLYQDFFYDYQLIKMQPDYIVPDYLTAWLLSEFPFGGKNTVLLERMIYEGKIRYLLKQALPELSEEVLFGYSEADIRWCMKNEAALWRTILERKQLYTPDLLTTTKYFEEGPSQFISEDAPGNLGRWMGERIVAKYMEQTHSTLPALMENQEAQDILAKSKYKP